MLRLFADKDLNRVMDIWLAGNLQAHPFVPEDYWRSQASRVREVINEAEVLVWEESGQIMGFLGMWGEHIEGVFVSQEFQGRGVGQALIQGAKERKPALALHVYQDKRRHRPGDRTAGMGDALDPVEHLRKQALRFYRRALAFIR